MPETSTNPTRKAVSKKVRFEVFKRDSFTCQYCGAKAPDVVLQADHIEPVSEGGGNAILNLITACDSCNAGKSNRRLSDDAVIVKQQDQLEKLQERREQLQMMSEWQRGLHDIDSEAVNEAECFWRELAVYGCNDTGLNILRGHIKKFGLSDVMSAMREASSRVEIGDDGKVTVESWNTAFDLIGRILRLERAALTDPLAKDIAYICGILKRRFSYWNHRNAGVFIRSAFTVGVPFEEVKAIAVIATSWTNFTTRLFDIIDAYRTEE